MSHAKMPLVSYSDSEESDIEPTPATVPAPASVAKPSTASKAKLLDHGKIKVDLPSIQPEPTESKDEQPPAKRARTAGAFGGFNSLLPAPKRTAPTSSGLKPGVSLRTSGEAAFSRQPPPVLEHEESGTGAGTNGDGRVAEEVLAAAEEAKIVGKATRFKPLSVGNKKKKPVTKPAVGDQVPTAIATITREDATPPDKVAPEAAAPPPKPKKSLFSVPHPDDDDGPIDTFAGTYESMTTQPVQPEDSEAQPAPSLQQLPPNPNSLQSLASDLDLTPAQRRQLFGRKAKDGDLNIAHFNMDSEYASNEQLRQAGEVVEHRAVKSIAPGKHSLQQLVNNAKSQREVMEDKWAEGRRERGGMSGRQ